MLAPSAWINDLNEGLAGTAKMPSLDKIPNIPQRFAPRFFLGLTKCSTPGMPKRARTRSLPCPR